MTERPPIILASASPRRRELLAQIGLAHDVSVADIDETLREGEAPAEYVLRMALGKARHAAARRARGDARPVLGADTAVVAEHHILGKPRDREDALRQLRLLSASEHSVLTAVALVDGGREQTRLSVSHVRFRPLDAAEIQAYWETGEPADKAGSYGIQGLAAIFASEIRGSYSGIMGLPLYETAELLRTLGCHPLGGNRET